MHKKRGMVSRKAEVGTVQMLIAAVIIIALIAIVIVSFISPTSTLFGGLGDLFGFGEKCESPFYYKEQIDKVVGGKDKLSPQESEDADKIYATFKKCYPESTLLEKVEKQIQSIKPNVAPAITITEPQIGEEKPLTTPFRGTVIDSDGISKLLITLLPVSALGPSQLIREEYQQKTEWDLEIDLQNEPDGWYQADVYATDASDEKKDSAHRTYFIKEGATLRRVESTGYDIIPVALEALPVDGDDLYADEPFVIAYWVLNTAQIRAKTFDVSIKLDGVERYKNSHRIAHGVQTTPFVLDENIHTITIEVSSPEQEESNINNNIFTKEITILPTRSITTNLLVTGLRIGPPLEPKEKDVDSEWFEVYYAFTKEGDDVPVYNQFTNKIYIDNQLVFSDRYNIPSDGTYDDRYSNKREEPHDFITPSRIETRGIGGDGIHILKIEIDADNTVTETDESDNVCEIPFEWGEDASSPKTIYLLHEPTGRKVDIPSVDCLADAKNIYIKVLQARDIAASAEDIIPITKYPHNKSGI